LAWSTASLTPFQFQFPRSAFWPLKVAIRSTLIGVELFVVAVGASWPPHPTVMRPAAANETK